MSTFFAATWPTFFMRVSPASRKAKPACMNITRIAARTTQIVLAATASCELDIDFHLLQGHAGAVVRDVVHGRRPDEAVARFVSAARGVRDRTDDARHAVVV